MINDYEEIKALFYAIHNNKQEDLKLVATILLKKGLNYMDILQLTKTVLKSGLGEAITLLEIHDYSGLF